MLRRPPRLFELLFLLFLISGLAWLVQRDRSKEGLDATFAELRQEILDNWGKGKLDACTRSCFRLLDLERGDMFALRYLGLIAMRQGDLPQAQEYFDKGLAQATSSSTEFMLASKRIGCLHRDRARYYVVRRDWTRALKDAERAKALLSSWDEDGQLASDVWCCAQVGAGNVSLAREKMPEPWGSGPLVQLLRYHKARLEGNSALARESSADQIWHPAADCPICKL